MEFSRAARFPQFRSEEDRQRRHLPDGPVTREWLDGCAEGILASRSDDTEAAQVRDFCRRLRGLRDGEPEAA